LKPRQTIAQRAAEVRDVIARFVAGLTSGRVKAIVSKQGAIAFNGLTESERDGVTDACVYRRIMSGTNAQAKMALARAEALAGKTVDRAIIGHGGAGMHSHDGGSSWHGHHK
jgi:hypothetical protein